MRRAFRTIWQNEFFRHVATLISGTSLAQAFAVLIYFALSRIYSDEDFGVFGLYMNILNITMIFSTAKYELAILLPKAEQDARNLVALSNFISLAVGLLLLLLVALFSPVFVRWLGSSAIAPWLWFIPLSTFQVGLFQAFRNYSNRHKRYRLIAGANISQSLGNSLVKLFLGLLITGAAGLICGVLVGQLIGLSVFLFFTLRHNRLSRFGGDRTPSRLRADPLATGRDIFRRSGVSLVEIKRMARTYSLFPRFNMWQGLINNLSGAFPVFVLTAHFSTGIAGLYTFGYMILYRPISLVATAFYQVMFQRFVEKQHQDEDLLPGIRLFLKRSIQVLALPFLLMAFFAPAVFSLLFGPEWTEAGAYARILLPWLFMTALVMPLSFIPDLYKKQAVAMRIDGIKLLLRLAGLFGGVWIGNVYIGLGLYSAASTLMILYSLLWYIRLVKRGKQSEQE